MNLLNSTFASIAKEQKRFAGATSLRGLLNFAAATTDGKKIITDHGSLKVSAFWCGVKNIADSIAILPKTIYKREGDKIEPQFNNAITNLIYRTPNRCMTASKFWFSFVVCLLIKGNGYARIVRDGAGNPIELQLLHPDSVTVHPHQGEKYFKVAGEKAMLFSDEVFHVPGFSFDGLCGISVLHYAAQNLQMTLSADAFGSEAYEDRAVNYGVIETDSTGLKPEGKNNLKKVFEYNLDTGSKNRVTVLDEGMKYKSISLSPAEAMFIEAKATGVEDIARWLNIPLHKLHTVGEGGYNFLVQMSIEYLQSSIMPLAQPIREEIERKLLTAAERKAGYYAHFNYKKLLEVDPVTRSQYYKDLVLIKALSPNEVRIAEDMNPYDGGDEYLQMANLLTQEQIEKALEDGDTK